MTLAMSNWVGNGLVTGYSLNSIHHSGDATVTGHEAAGDITPTMEQGEMQACLPACVWISFLTLLQSRITHLGNDATCSGQDLPTSVHLRQCPIDMATSQPSVGSSSLRFFSQVTLGFVMLTKTIIVLGNLGKLFIHKYNPVIFSELKLGEQWFPK